MEEELKSHLRSLAVAFLAKSKLAPSTMWARAAKDARFLDRVEGGKGFTVKTYDSAVRWFFENWPEGAKWPADVPRPIRSETDERQNVAEVAA